MKTISMLPKLRALALAAVAAGAGGSIGLTLYTGRNNHSVLLILLFAAWVLSPFIALLVANLASKHWQALTRMSLYILTLGLAIVSPVAYSGAWSPPGTKPAFMFLVFPLLSWLLIAIVIRVAAAVSRRQSGGSEGN